MQELSDGSPGRRCRCTRRPDHHQHCTGRSLCSQDGPHREQLRQLVTLPHPVAREQPGK